jgi:hypothetical protein
MQAAKSTAVPIGDFDLAPGPMHVEEDEQIGCANTLVLAIITLQLSRLGLDRLTNLAKSVSASPGSGLPRVFAKTTFKYALAVVDQA